MGNRNARPRAEAVTNRHPHNPRGRHRKVSPPLPFPLSAVEGRIGETRNNERVAIMSNDFDPMIYDVMRELATQLRGRYLEWANLATDERAAQHWTDAQVQVLLEARAIDPDDAVAIMEHTAQLEARLADLPREAPILA